MAHPFFDVTTYPISRVEAVELERVLVGFARDPRQIEVLYLRLGAGLPGLNLQQAPNLVWLEALRNLTRAALMKAFCESFPRDKIAPDFAAAIDAVTNAVHRPEDDARTSLVLSPALQARVKSLDVPQFQALLGALNVSTDGLADRPSANERLDYLQSKAAALRESDVEQALLRVLGVTSSDEATLQLVRASISDATAQMDRAVAPGAPLPLAQQVIAQIGSIRSAKQIHDRIQHQFAYKLGEFARIATQLIKKPSSRLAAFRIVRTVTEDIERASEDAKSLRRTYRTQVEEASVQVLATLRKLTTILTPDSPVDDSAGTEMTTVLDMELRTYVIQIPSLMQRLLADESVSIPWIELGALVSTPLAPGSDPRPFAALQSLFDELVREHGRWQDLTNQLSRIVERLDAFFTGAERTVNEVKFLAKRMCDIAATVPLASECVPLARAFWVALKMEKVDVPEKPTEDDVRYRLEALESFITGNFHRSDAKLLTACGELENISQSLRKFS